MRFAFIAGHRARWPVEVMCDVLQVSRAGFYAWRNRAESDRSHRRTRLTTLIRAVHAESRSIYGSPRVTMALKARGESVCENTVAKLMRKQGMISKVRRRFVPRTTDANHAHPIAPNRLERDFTASGPNRTWVSDITYVPTDEGWLYVSVVLDVWSRKVVGWSMTDHLRAEGVCDALRMAVARRRPAAGLVHHSDRGVQYACDAYQRLLAEHGLICSMSRSGDCYDNALAESFFGTLKTELVYHEHYATRQDAARSIFEYLEVFYNRQRRHSSLGYISPEAFEAATN